MFKIIAFVKVILFVSITAFCSESIKRPPKVNWIESTALEIPIPESKDFEIVTGVSNNFRGRPALQLGIDAAISSRTSFEFDLSQILRRDSLPVCETQFNYCLINDPLNELIMNSGVEMEMKAGKGFTIAPAAIYSIIKTYNCLMLTGKVWAGAEFGLRGEIKNEIDPELGIALGPFFNLGFFQIGVPLTASYENEKLSLLLQSEIDLRINPNLVGTIIGYVPISSDLSKSGQFRLYTGFKADL